MPWSTACCSSSASRSIEERERVKAKLGLTRFAEFRSPFDGAYRTLNFAWSAAVDGHADEAHECIHLARELRDEAATRLES